MFRGCGGPNFQSWSLSVRKLEAWPDFPFFRQTRSFSVL